MPHIYTAADNPIIQLTIFAVDAGLTCCPCDPKVSKLTELQL